MDTDINISNIRGYPFWHSNGYTVFTHWHAANGDVHWHSVTDRNGYTACWCDACRDDPARQRREDAARR
jgi:hypothetical protein